MRVNYDIFNRAWIQEFRDVQAKIEAIPASTEQTTATLAFGELHDATARQMGRLMDALIAAHEFLRVRDAAEVLPVVETAIDEVRGDFPLEIRADVATP